MDPLTGQVIIVESTVWVDFFRGIRTVQTTWLLSELGRRPLQTLDLILCEVLQGIPKQSAYVGIREQMLKVEIYNTGGLEVALESAENYRRLRSQGSTIRTTIDCIIATYCIQRGFMLLHNDRDFDPFEKHLGLKIFRPDMRPGTPEVH